MYRQIRKCMDLTERLMKLTESSTHESHAHPPPAKVTESTRILPPPVHDGSPRILSDKSTVSDNIAFPRDFGDVLCRLANRRRAAERPCLMCHSREFFTGIPSPRRGNTRRKRTDDLQKPGVFRQRIECVRDVADHPTTGHRLFAGQLPGEN